MNDLCDMTGAHPTRANFCRCQACGRPGPCGAIASCSAKPIALAGEPRGLGDYLESLLKFFGITQMRYRKLKKTMGFKDSGGCGCNKRKKKLNTFGKTMKLTK